MIRLNFPFVTPSQNETNNWHWAKRARHRKDMGAWVQSVLAKKELQLAPVPRSVIFIRCGVRQLDKGNLIGGCKSLLDALVKGGLFVDDSPRWIDDHYDQKTCSRAQIGTIVLVFPNIIGMAAVTRYIRDICDELDQSKQRSRKMIKKRCKIKAT